MTALCCKLVFGHPGKTCDRPAKFQHNGQHYCGIHNPLRLAANRAKARKAKKEATK